MEERFLGEIIREKRLEQGLSLEELSETYYLCKIIGDDENRKIIEDGFMEYYGVKI